MSAVRDILVICILLFAVGISLVLIVDLSHRINANILVAPSINDTAEAVEVIVHTEAAINQTDYIYLALFIGFFIGIMVFGYFVGGHPIMAPIYFFIVVVFAFIAVILQLVWGDIASNSELIGATVSLPITCFILAHLVYFTIVFGLLGIVAMFAKPAESV